MSNIYTLHTKDNDPSNVIAVKEQAFCLTAFVFGILWALYYRMWIVVSGLIAINIILTHFLSTKVITNEGGIAIQLCINIIFSMFAYDLRRLTLRMKGYRFFDIVRGNSASDAKYNWLDYEELKNYVNPNNSQNYSNNKL